VTTSIVFADRQALLRQDAGEVVEAGVDSCPAHISCSVDTSAPGTLRLVVHGEIDMASSPAMRRILDAGLDDVPAGGTVVVDMSGVGFLSAAGLRDLVAVSRAARERGVTVRLGPVSDVVERVLAATRVRREIERGPRDAGVPV
jgi:anti-sigma B factor antagonist